MKKLTIAILIGLMSASGWGACTYDLDATQAQISTFPSFPTSTKFPNITSQEVSHLIRNNDNDPFNISAFAATSATFTQTKPLGDKIIGTNGIYATEYKIDNFYTPLINNDNYIYHGLAINLSNASSAVKIGQVILVNDNSGLNLVFFMQNPDGSNSVDLKYPISNSVSMPFRFGIYVNQDSKKIGLNVNGVDKGYLVSFTGNINKIGFVPSSAQARIGTGSNIVGSLIKGELIIDKAKYGLTYALGTKDICGNTI
jgi:hypothetical protein